MRVGVLSYMLCGWWILKKLSVVECLNDFFVKGGGFNMGFLFLLIQVGNLDLLVRTDVFDSGFSLLDVNHFIFHGLLRFQ
jgi:hypothetical protein